MMINCKSEFEEELEPVCAGEQHADKEEKRMKI